MCDELQNNLKDQQERNTNKSIPIEWQYSNCYTPYSYEPRYKSREDSGSVTELKVDSKNTIVKTSDSHDLPDQDVHKTEPIKTEPILVKTINDDVLKLSSKDSQISVRSNPNSGTAQKPITVSPMWVHELRYFRYYVCFYVIELMSNSL